MLIYFVMHQQQTHNIPELKQTSPSIEISAFAKIIGWGPYKLFKQLRDDGYLMKSNGRINQPYSKYAGTYFKMVTIQYRNKKTGQVQFQFQTQVTLEGQKYLTEKYGK